MADQKLEAAPKPPPTERDPFGMRHSLANLAMMVTGLEGEEPEPYKLAIFSARIVALGFLFTGDALGSLVAEARQIREHLGAIRVNSERRPPKPSKQTP